MLKVRVNRYTIGEKEPCFIIAEAGSNHDRKLGQAKKLIDIAAEAGADAVKFQTFTAEKLAVRTKADFTKIDFGGAQSLFELYKKLELPRKWQQELFLYSREKGIMFLSTPFDNEAVDELDQLGVEAFKIASFEMIHLSFLKYIAQKGKPIILSTGTANLGEIEEALETIYKEGNRQVILLHCALNYPARFENVHLAAMDTMRQAFQVPVGYSDHTLGLTVPIAAVALGANVIEKHFTIDKNLPGPDHSFALNPKELKDLIRCVREAEAAIGLPYKRAAEDEAERRKRSRRSIFAKVFIPSGTIITDKMVTVLRPGIGLKPKYMEVLIGRKARKDIKAYEPITWDII